MKKVITLLMAMTMVIGFAGIAAADCFNCAGTAGNIDRGCETGQDYCAPFDFENPNDYCSEDKSTPNRAVFKICDCITDGDFETVIAGDTIDISMEILVNGETGDNGVYWAEGVNSIEMVLFENQDDACDKEFNDVHGVYEYTNLNGTEAAFVGNYEYRLANGSVGDYTTSDGCDIEDIDRSVKIQLDPEVGVAHGYVVTDTDEVNGNATWAIDIPEMRVDPSMVSAGDQVWVRICLILDCAGICSEDVICCCDIYIGELCCSFDSASGSGLIYPYFPPANTTVWNMLGMTITNLSALEGEATITMYEDDGDVGTLDVTIDGNGIYLETIPNLAAAMTSTGTMGDSMCYLTVTADFPATGFAMIADTIDGASMGYLPLQAWETNPTSLISGMFKD